MALKKIQEIKFNNYVELEALIPMYCRGSVSIQTISDGSARLMRGQGFDFLTYFNSLPIGKWRRYTKAYNFCLVLDVVGRFDLDLVGHLSKHNHHQKEWGGRFSFDVPERRKITIPIPNTMRSDLISFGINIIEDTYVYDAYYGAEIEGKDISAPHISIVTEVRSDTKTISDNLFLLKDEIFESEEYSGRFDWILIDPKKKMDENSLPEYVKTVSNVKEFEHYTSGSSHMVIADESDIFFVGSFKRLYVFLSFLKDAYKKYEITGAVLNDEHPNMQSDVFFDKDEPFDSVQDFAEKIKNTDLAIWSNIIDNESDFGEKRYAPGLFYCLKKGTFDIKTVFSQKDDSGTGNPLLRPLENSIRLSGVCAWAPDVSTKIQEARKNNNQKNSNKTALALQDLVMPGEIEIEVTKNMYYRSDGHVLLTRDEEEKEKVYTFVNGFYYDFFTYFNAFSHEKWEKYTEVDNIYLMLEAKGSFKINLFGHFKSKVGFQKEWFGEQTYDLHEKETLIIPYPKGMQSNLISFGITAFRDFKLYKASYMTEIEKKKIKTPHISMVTTTFKKENFIERNISLLTDRLLDDENYRDYFSWYIIDNGRSVKEPNDLDDNIHIVPNDNVGGAGGFARGQMESIRRNNKTTHILFMDDDVVFIPDSFKKLCNFLKVLKDDYKDHFIGGAMLKTGQPNIQHENTGWLNDLGDNESIKTNYDLNLWDVIINNEEINDNIPNRFAAFWFCCVPTSVATLDNLPLPVFFRGDDIEYSLRNKAKIITMNGLCIWHEGFEGRFSASLDFYLTVRNKLMLCAINSHLNDIPMVENVTKNFWEEMRKYDYKGAAFFLDALEDFMKGPEFYKKTNGEANMKEKKAADNKLRPINPTIRSKIDYSRLYHAEPLSDQDYQKYKTTCNLQDAAELKKTSTGNVNEQSLYGTKESGGRYKKKKVGVIPYGWGYWPSKVYKMDEIIAVDPANDTYVIYKKDKDEFAKLKQRFEQLMKNYEKNGEKIIKDYQKAQSELAGEKFWDGYLNTKK